MPIYESHVGSPDFVGAAERFKPFDLAATVQAGMDTALQMTMAQQKIIQNQHQMALDAELQPYRIQKAKSEVDLLESEKRTYDLEHAPDVLRAHQQAQIAQDNLKMKQSNDSADLANHSVEIMELKRLSRTDPQTYLAKREGMLHALQGNTAFASMLDGIDQEFDNSQFAGTDNALHKGAELRLHPDKLSGLSGLNSKTQEEMADISAKTQLVNRRSQLIQQFNGNREMADKVMASEQSDFQRKAQNAVSFYDTFNAIGGEQQKIEERKLAKAELPPGAPSEQQFQKSVEDTPRKFFDMADHTLSMTRDRLQTLAANGDVEDWQASRQIAKIDLMRKQLETLRPSVSSILPSLYGVTRGMRAAIRGAASKFFDQVNGDKELAEFSDIYDMVKAGNEQQAYAKMLDWGWNFMGKRTLTQQRQKLDVLQKSMGASPVTAILPEVGGSPGGGLPTYTPEQAAALTPGTEFIGTDGIRRRK